ncbi:MAG TPA: molybdenum cofactor biosynthesis protein B [Alcaligenaceae bacterium]|nr:molybdenum cofactor biosynthesis protein B [Alcaligenaceae bacterium]
MISLQCAVLTISNSRTAANDTSGDYLVDQLQRAGHICVERGVSKANVYELRKIVSQWIADPAIQVIITNGGTGFNPDKNTIAALEPLFDTTIVGFGEVFRQLSFQEIGSAAIQSEAIAGLANKTVIFCVPGSTNACRLAWARLIRDQLNSQHKPCNFADHCVTKS